MCEISAHSVSFSRDVLSRLFHIHNRADRNHEAVASTWMLRIGIIDRQDDSQDETQKARARVNDHRDDGNVMYQEKR